MAPKGILFDSIEDAGSSVNFTKLDENIYKIWLHSYENINIYTDHISDENLNNLSLSIQSALKILKPKEITYMVQFPGWNRLVFDLKSKYKGNVVFDCMDDHSGFSTNDDSSLKEEKELIKNSDIVISSSQLLYDKNIKLNKNTIQVKNGTEFEYFNNSTTNGKLDYLSDKPIIGYYGAISDWFDMDMIEYCAKQLPNYNFVMIGATFGCDISKAEKIENIHFLGEIPYNELAGYFACFDVCLIPFKIIPLTLATNPVKFYEYLSAGKPVVSVELPELIPYSKYCYLAKDKEVFCIKIDEALNEESQSKREDRMSLAKENSWSKRADAIYEKLEEK
jgi:glycosyltransferase involved in cell wall biosynthesis